MNLFTDKIDNIINTITNVDSTASSISASFIAPKEKLQCFTTIDPFNVCKHRKPRLGARAAWGQKNGAANRPAYCVKEKQTSLIDR